MKNLFDIKGKVIVITGGCGILGKNIANYLAEQGAKIVVLDRAAEIGKELEAELYHLRHERDQAVEDLNTLRKRSDWKCEACYYNDHYNRDICTGCEYNNDNNWQWRGVQEENNG